MDKQEKETSQAFDNETPTHDARGKFAKGNKLGRGNPFAKKVQQYKAAIYEACKKADFKEIAQKAIDQAKAGDKYAREWVSDRLIGKVSTPIEVNQIDQNQVDSLVDDFFANEVNKPKKQEDDEETVD